MRFRLPPLRDVPTVWSALRWLLAHRGGPTADRDILVKARLCGLLTADGSTNWKVNGPLATRLAESALSRLPRDPEQLGKILHGLGEMNARTTAGFVPSLVKHLGSRRPKISFFKVLSAAAECEAKVVGKPSLDAVDLAQWVSGAPFDWSTFDRAVRRIGHPDIRISPGRYGLSFVARIVATIEPRAIDRWVAGHRNRQRVATIATVFLPSMYDAEMFGRALLFLRSGIPSLKCLAAAHHVCPLFSESSIENFQDCRRHLVANGINPGDATWMMAYRLKNAIHARYWAEHQLEEAGLRLRYLKGNPDAAMGGRHNFDAEVRMLQNQIDNASQRLGTLASDIESMLGDLAAGWPADGLSDDQMKSLEQNFVSTPEIRHRLAEKLPPEANRAWLLKQNIDQIREFIGLEKDPAHILDTFNAEDKQFEVIALWAARSLILLYEQDSRGIGKRTSDLVAGITAAFEALAAEPYAAARKPERWQSAQGRAASAYIFALLVVALMPEQRRAEVKILHELALDHVFKLLCVTSPDIRSSQLLFKLIARAVLQMDDLADGDASRRQWAEATAMPPFARSFALWSSPALARKDRKLAFDLMQRVAEPPLSRGARDLRLSQMLTLLDLAIARCATADPTLADEVIAAWSENYRDWRPVSDRWSNIAQTLVAAIDREGPERDTVLAEPAFANTHCVRLIASQDAANRQSRVPE